METLPFLFVVVLVVCLMPSALALKCYECRNVPGYSGASQCSDEHVRSITCGMAFGRCMTIKGVMTVPGAGSLNIEMKNCSNRLFCAPNRPFSSDMCNGNGTGTGNGNGNGASRITALITSMCNGNGTGTGNGNGNGASRITALITSMCNGNGTGTGNGNGNGASRITALITSFAAILLALVMNL
ncbi:hypothetical protein ACROYT_G034362 [Oculina patagonica]